MPRLAVVLFNLGGPDRPEAVQPFLLNLFFDPAIISLPAPLRWLVARLIARRRAPLAREIYHRIGGRSPLLEQSEAQARALERRLGAEIRCFVAMRYWHPFSEEAAAAVAAWRADAVVLLPLYPQFSTTTTGSSVRAWGEAAQRVGLAAPTRLVCCYPTAEGLVAALARLTAAVLDRFAGRRVRLLFSAHGLPEKVIRGGDPYQWQVEQTAAAVVARLGRPGLDWVVCYQSRVGPLKWIGPATDAEIRRAGGDGRAVVVVPIAFTSEHVETLVELDLEYAALARDCGVPAYERVPTVGVAPEFIEALATAVETARAATGTTALPPDCRCPGVWQGCPQRQGMP